MIRQGTLDIAGKSGAIVVVGGGISGMQSALDAANSGFKVYLVEERPSIGGVMAQLDKTFPTNDCSTCMLSPKLIEVAKNPNIEILSYAEVLDIRGNPGDFQVSIRKKARYVDAQKCIGCGLCASKCPKKVADEFNQGLGQRKAIYLTFAQAIPLVYTIDKESCIYFQKGRCRACEKFCPNKAVDFEQQDEVIGIEAGAVILAPGFETFDARLKGEYGYGRYANVLTSLDYERILSAGGPFGGHIQRPSDGCVPKKIAWIQCVGSRDATVGCEYCSYVCCMYATKQALISRDHDHEIEPTIFYIDIRAQGKGFDRYYERARCEGGVRYIRSMVSKVVENTRDKTLEISYVDASGQIQTEVFDLVILSVGLRPNSGFQALAGKLGIALNEFGFCRTLPLDLVSTSREGLFVSGAFQSPKDIPDTVIQASSAAGAAACLLAEARGTMIKEKVYPEEKQVVGHAPRIGVFVCHCGINIAGVIDVRAVAEYSRSLPGVVYATDYLFTCSTDSQQEMKKAIEEHGLNRVVVASCSPRTHEALFQETLREAGLNKYLFEMANIRDQASWVHAGQGEAATTKAKDLVRMSVARAGRLEPLSDTSFEVIPKALVVGGGVAGLTAALTLAENGYETCLVERSDELGGNARFIHYTEDGASPAGYVAGLIENIKKHPLVTVYTRANVVDCSGHIGHFKSRISADGEVHTVSYGAAIIATGGEEYKPQEYLYGSNDRVLTQREFEQQLAAGANELRGIKNVAMIQCVGSRDETHPYCSRTCCTAAIKNSRKLKALNPHSNIYILFRDMRTFAFKEVFYKKAREEGIRFIRYEPERRPRVIERDGKLTVNVYDQNLGTELEIEVERLVLSAAIRPHPWSFELANVLKLPLDQDGFFMEAHLKLRPLDFVNAGFFLCGLAHGPKFVDESIAQAKGAVSRACTILSKKKMFAGGDVAQVDAEKCILCLTCVRTCPYGVPRVDEEEGVIVIDAAACQGCGNCASACPRGAIVVGHNTEEQYIAKISALYRLDAAAG
ncbi:MAG: CoB--CoM heterodisulfide reductase iron-sulfur subunit A family protein [Thermodesulfobacteriota bacterium]